MAARFAWSGLVLVDLVSGKPITNGTINFWANGTTNDQDTFPTVGLSGANANPLVLSSAGQVPEAWSADTKVYAVRVRDENNNVIMATVQDMSFIAPFTLSSADVLAALEANSAAVDIAGSSMVGSAFAAFADNLDLTAAGSIDASAGAITLGTVTGATTFSAVVTHGADVVSDTDSTDSLGTTGVRWAKLWVDDITMGGTLGAAAITCSTIVASGIIKTNDTTDASSTTDGSVQTDGGWSVVKKSYLGDTVTIDQDTNAISLSIDTEATTANIIDIISPTITTGFGLSISSASGLTTGRLLSLDSDSTDTSTRILAKIINTNSAAIGTTVLDLQQNAAQRVLRVDQNTNFVAVTIETLATTADIVDIQLTLLTTGNLFNADNANALTTGSFFNFKSNSADTTARSLGIILNDNAAAVNVNCLELRNDAEGDAGAGVLIKFAGNETADTTSSLSSNTTSGAILGHAKIDFGGVIGWLAITDTPS